MAEQQQRNWPRTRTPFLRATWRAVVSNRCPHCAQAPMFVGFYTLEDRCPSCDLRYQAESGAWLGALALGYGIGAAVAVVLAVLEIMFNAIEALGLPPVWTIAVLALVATVIGYRPAKAAWFVLLYYFGFMAFGDARPGPPPPA